MRAAAWLQPHQAPYYKGVPSLRTTRSSACAAALLVMGLLSGSSALAQTLPGAGVQRLPTTPRGSVAIAAPPAQPPLVADGLIFVALEDGVLAAHSASNGSEVWRTTMAAARPLAAHDGLVIVAGADAVQALSKADGTARWRSATGPLSAPLRVQDGWILAATEQNLLLLRAADGSEAWRRPPRAFSQPPVIAGGVIYLPRADGVVEALDLASGETRWTTRLGGAPAGVLVAEGRLYVGSADRYFYALDAESGDIDWRYRIGAVMRGAPAADGSRVFTASLDNLLRAFDLDHGAREWKAGVPFRPIAGPIVLGGIALVPGSAAELPMFDASTGAARGTLALGAPLALPPAIGAGPGGLLVLAALTGSLSSGWSLVLFDSSVSLPVAPLTALPGVVVPLPPPKK